MKAISTAVRALMLTAFAAACGGGSSAPGPAPGTPDGQSAQLTVERFLQSANRNDWSTMAELFGTAQQNIAQRDGSERAERHMQLLASLLRHDDFIIEDRRNVAGRPGATSILVRITRDDEDFSVPFMLVPRNSGGWIIERIDNLETLT